MRIHILGICGSFMAGLAVLARALGHDVSGSDAAAYPPMSTQLEAAGIHMHNGYAVENLTPAPDVVVIGNALSRGNVEVEAVLDRGLRYISGAQWIAEHVLQGRWVVAVAGTHGKTTTASMIAWILEQAGHRPGFLIGGVPQNFGISARLGDTPFFVIEADEYDTAFFDKRSKFLHYRPRTLVLNNLEFDHADIFADLDAIKRQFHHLVRTVPASGLIVVNAADRNLGALLELGCWTPVEYFENAKGWSVAPSSDDRRAFTILARSQPQAQVRWDLPGRHNTLNALAAVVAARHTGVDVATSAAALASFENVQRRLQVRGRARGITVYDDFAHHPTEIAASLQALRACGSGRIFAVLELRSNSMRMGVHQAALPAALGAADRILILQPPALSWDLRAITTACAGRAHVLPSVEAIVAALTAELRERDQVLVMSNGDFGGIHESLLECLRA
ncbi:MAG: UDP-N-acetylmuramate:L-alanyl-gamma-D-glutamyl-meso-diaminopimelate ligase [Acidiferrobacterales bacterium]|nr:UDP-N-acetylmuramate:L-alanyl-gamma-D-glutamyl-meso-diaminopimelate ligase [Acidiferrobacterales bacterium]